MRDFTPFICYVTFFNLWFSSFCQQIFSRNVQENVKNVIQSLINHFVDMFASSERNAIDLLKHWWNAYYNYYLSFCHPTIDVDIKNYLFCQYAKLKNANSPINIYITFSASFSIHIYKWKSRTTQFCPMENIIWQSVFICIHAYQTKNLLKKLD